MIPFLLFWLPRLWRKLALQGEEILRVLLTLALVAVFAILLLI